MLKLFLGDTGIDHLGLYYLTDMFSCEWIYHSKDFSNVMVICNLYLLCPPYKSRAHTGVVSPILWPSKTHSSAKNLFHGFSSPVIVGELFVVELISRFTHLASEITDIPYLNLLSRIFTRNHQFPLLGWKSWRKKLMVQKWWTIRGPARRGVCTTDRSGHYMMHHDR